MKYFIFPCTTFFIILMSCQEKIDLNHEKSRIIEILQKERTNHFEKDAAGFTALFADSIISVNRGEVRKNSRAEMAARFGSYFSNVEFVKWDDTAAPIIEISNDGTMAYAIVQKQVEITFPDSLGNTTHETTHFAWMAIYRKINGVWKGVANASTDMPK